MTMLGRSCSGTFDDTRPTQAPSTPSGMDTYKPPSNSRYRQIDFRYLTVVQPTHLEADPDPPGSAFRFCDRHFSDSMARDHEQHGGLAA
jgi:hypothetical protein